MRLVLLIEEQRKLSEVSRHYITGRSIEYFAYALRKRNDDHKYDSGFLEKSKGFAESKKGYYGQI